MDWRRLDIDIDGLDCDRMLADWRWLVPADLRPVVMNLFGDWFLEDRQGRVHLLDTLGGKLALIASSRAAFLAGRESPANLDEWYMADLALLCWENGLRPGLGQCLRFKIPPVLRGPVALENVEVGDLVIHQRIMGQIHRGVQNLPQGTIIDRFTVDGEVP